ncbi:MAG TPA: aminoglycoside phosphotransferase family protein [Kiloniellales bacterium]|nr:aminoglycoside phosphotransferase family protein [Kiloniellales bacterium]
MSRSDIGPGFDAAGFLALRGLAPPGLRLQQEALTGGYWNQVVRVRGRGLDLVVKRFHTGRGPLRFPNLPDAEAAALQRLAESGHVPRFRRYFRDEPDNHPILVYDFVAGRPWDGDPGAVGRALGAIHRLTLPADPHPFRRLAFRASSMAREVARMAEETPGLAETARWQALAKVAPAQRELPVPPALSVIHTDCGPGNLIEAPDGRVVVIDWQTCGAGDPAEDLYAFLSPAFQILSQRLPLHSGERARFLVGHGDPAAETRLKALLPYYAHRMLAYCALRTLTLRDGDPGGADRYARAFDTEFAEVFG